MSVTACDRPLKSSCPEVICGGSRDPDAGTKWYLVHEKGSPSSGGLARKGLLRGASALRTRSGWINRVQTSRPAPHTSTGMQRFEQCLTPEEEMEGKLQHATRRWLI